MKFHGALGDAQVFGNIFVVVTAQQLIEHFPLAGAEAGQRLAQALAVALVLALRSGSVQGLGDAVHQLVVLKRLF